MSNIAEPNSSLQALRELALDYQIPGANVNAPQDVYDALKACLQKGAENAEKVIARTNDRAERSREQQGLGQMLRDAGYDTHGTDQNALFNGVAKSDLETDTAFQIIAKLNFDSERLKDIATKLETSGIIDTSPKPAPSEGANEWVLAA